MFNRSELKTKAKIVLSRSFIMSFLACFAVSMVSSGGLTLGTQRLQNINPETMSNVKLLLASGIIGLLGIIGILFIIFLVSPLIVGLKKFMLNTAKGSCNIEDLLYPFKNNYKNITLTMFMKDLFILLWTLPAIVVVSAILLIFNLPEYMQTLAIQVQADSVPAALLLIAITTAVLLVAIALMIPAIIKDLQYSMVQYILADDPDINWKQAIIKSKEMMVGNKWAYIKLMFSFTGWYILANMVCCVGASILAPYIEATYAQMYIEISGQSDDYAQTNYQSTNFYTGFGNM